MQIKGSIELADGTKQLVTLDIPGTDDYVSTSLFLEEEESLPVSVKLKEEETLPVSVKLEEEESLPVSVKLEEEESLPVNLVFKEGEKLEVSLSSDSVKALSNSISASIPKVTPVDVSFMNTCLLACTIGVFACLGALCIKELIERLRA